MSTAQDTGPGASRTPRFDVEARVLLHPRIILNEFEIVLYAPEIAMCARAGQFVMMVFGDGYSTDVRRPFSLFKVDPEAGTISILYLARGSFTSDLAQKQPGDTISITGPLGTPFDWFSRKESRHILVAGGIGAPPICFLAREISDWRLANPDTSATILVINGAKSAELLVGVSEFQALDVDLSIVTIDGSSGEQGVATDRLQIELGRRFDFTEPTVVYACGPMPMLRNVAALGVTAEVSCQVSIETAMPCGVGECDGCFVRILDSLSPTGLGIAKACWDGPVFEAASLAWEL